MIKMNDTPSEVYQLAFSTFFSTAFSWAADINNPECQLHCLDFLRISIIITDNENLHDDFEKLSDDNILAFTQLFISLSMAGSTKVRESALHCLSQMMIATKEIRFLPEEAINFFFDQFKSPYQKILEESNPTNPTNISDATPISSTTMTTPNNYIIPENNTDFANNSYYEISHTINPELSDKMIHNIFEFIALTLILLRGDKKLDISFLHHVVNFDLVFFFFSHGNSSLQYYTSLIIQSFANNGPISIDILLTHNFLETAIQVFTEGGVKAGLVNGAIMKEFFFLATPNQMVTIFQSGVIGPFLQYLEDSLEITTASCIFALNNAIKLCVDTFGIEFIDELKNIFSGSPLHSIHYLFQNGEDTIYEQVSILLQLLDEPEE